MPRRQPVAGKRATETPPRLVTDAERAQVRELHGQGLSRNAIAKEIGRPWSTVTKIARDLGLSFDREQVKAATAARVADARAIRAETSLRFLAKTNELLAQMDEPHLVFAFGGKENTYNEHRLDRPPTGDLRNLMTSAATAFSSHLKADLHDSGAGTDDAVGMLGKLAEGLAAAHRQMTRDAEPGES